MNKQKQPTVAGQVEPSVRPCAWMAQFGRQPVQATVSQQQADAWAQAGGDVAELYDGQTLWNAVARAAQLERERWIAKAGRAYTDAHAIFNDPPSETPQVVRDVIEWHLHTMRANEEA